MRRSFPLSLSPCSSCRAFCSWPRGGFHRQNSARGHRNVLFLYGPVAVIWNRRRRIDFLDDGFVSYLKSIRTFLIVALIVFPPYLMAAHFWQLTVGGYSSFSAAGFSDFWSAAMFQILIVALPEEFYFRGYFQVHDQPRHAAQMECLWYKAGLGMAYHGACICLRAFGRLL